MSYSTEINRELWQSELQAQIFKKSDFMQKCMDLSFAADQAHRVHIPQSGSLVGAKVTPSSFPLTATRRTDTDHYFDMRQHYLDPIYGINIADLEKSYDYRMTVMSQQYLQIYEAVSDYMLYDWAFGITAQVNTSGAGRAARDTTYQSGNRSGMTFTDLLEANRRLTKANIPVDGRVLILPTDMRADLNALIVAGGQLGYSLIVSDKISTDGYIGTLAGVQIIERSDVCWVSGTTVLSPTAVAAISGAGATLYAKQAGILYHPSYVAKSTGSIRIHFDADSPLYLGPVMNCDLRSGGKYMRSDLAGVCLIVESLAV
jgi:hypothetical protein